MPDTKVRKTICFSKQMDRYRTSNLQTMRFPKPVNIKMISEELKTWSMMPKQIFIPAGTEKS